MIYRTLLILLVVEFVSFRLFIAKTGFFVDDWILLEYARQAGGFFETIARLWKGVFAVRPVGLLGYAIVYTLAEPHPMVGQVIIAGLKSFEALFLFLFLNRLLKWRRLAFLAALLAMICPVREALHFWLTTSVNLAAHIFLLASFLLHMDWLRTRSRFKLIGGQMLYAAAFLTYEAVAFLPLMLIGGLAARDRLSGATAAGALKKAVKECVPYLIPFVLVVLWQWLGSAFIFETKNPKHLAPSLSHFFVVYSGGLSSLTIWMLDNCAASFLFARKIFTARYAFLWTAFVGGLVWVFRRQPEPGTNPLHSLWVLLAASVAAFFASYLPFALSGQYPPQIYERLSRTNGIGAWVCGAWLAGLIAALGPRSPWAAKLRFPAFLSNLALALVVGAFTWTNWHTSLRWSAAWKLEQQILERVSNYASKVPPGGILLLRGAPEIFISAPVFTKDSYDFSYALKYFTKRRDIRGGVLVAPSTEESWYAGEKRRFVNPKENLFGLKKPQMFLYDLKKNVFLKFLESPSERLLLARYEAYLDRELTWDTIRIPRSAFPKDQTFAEGTPLQLTANGRKYRGNVLSSDAETVLVETYSTKD